MNPLVEILQQLIEFESVTPKDEGCQTYMMDFLKSIGFDCMVFDNTPVSNFFAKIGDQKPLLVFAGHTDVVPTGDLSKWSYPPFKLTVKDNELFGRGVADMKGSLASMMLAAKKFLTQHPNFKGSIGFLITSGEEGDEFDKGTPYVMQQLQSHNILPQYCIVGEPSSHKEAADVIKVGRRGSLTGKIEVCGKQGHVAYPHLAQNPIHIAAKILDSLATIEFDQGDTFFPPTSLQITQVTAGAQANNVIPGNLDFSFNIRYNTTQSLETLTTAVTQAVEAHHGSYSIKWQHNGEPFITKRGELVEACKLVIEKITGKSPILSTDGGTSDGRFIAPYGVQVVELGPVNATIHQVNEHASLADLTTLTEIYYQLCLRLLRAC